MRVSLENIRSLYWTCPAPCDCGRDPGGTRGFAYPSLPGSSCASSPYAGSQLSPSRGSREAGSRVEQDIEMLRHAASLRHMSFGIVVRCGALWGAAWRTRAARQSIPDRVSSLSCRCAPPESTRVCSAAAKLNAALCIAPVLPAFELTGLGLPDPRPSAFDHAF